MTIKLDRVVFCYAVASLPLIDIAHQTQIHRKSRFQIFDPPDQYIQTWCPSVLKTKTHCNANVGTRKTKYALRRTPCVQIIGCGLVGHLNFTRFVFLLFAIPQAFNNEVLHWSGRKNLRRCSKQIKYQDKCSVLTRKTGK